MNTYDVVVIGGGAAGLSAALVLTRARRRVAVIDAGEPRNAPAAHMQGFLSRDGMPPAELLTVGRTEVAGYGGELIDGSVVGITRHTGAFGILMSDGTALIARRVLIATGLRDEIVDIPGATERWARDVLHCPYCHGHEVRDQALGVLGGNPASVQHALLIRQWSADIVFFAHTTEVSAEEREQLTACGIDIVDGEVKRVVTEDDRLTGVELTDGRLVRRDHLFVRPTFVASNDFLRGLGATTDAQGWPVVDGTGATSVPGIWAAGNAVNPRAQVITAAGEGSAAAIAINADLVDEDVRAAVDRFRGGLPGQNAHSHDTDERELMTNPNARPAGPPTKHQLALMIWLCVFPTLTVINLTLSDWLSPMSPVLRTFVLATIAVPIVIYGLMPQLHKVRKRLLSSS